MDPVGICNLALGRIGEKPITSFNDASRVAELCKAAFDPARDAVLEARAWTFAIERLAPIAADATAPAFGYSYRHLLPASVLRVLTCEDGTENRDLKWEREGQYIVDDVSGELFVKAVVRVEDPTKWSSGFCDTLAYKLASVLVVPISDNLTLQQELEKLYRIALREAGARDALQGRAEQRTSTWLRNARG